MDRAINNNDQRMIGGTFVFGYVNEVTGSMRNSIVALVVFFVIGIILLRRLNKLDWNTLNLNK